MHACELTAGISALLMFATGLLAALAHSSPPVLTTRMPEFAGLPIPTELKLPTDAPEPTAPLDQSCSPARKRCSGRSFSRTMAWTISGEICGTGFGPLIECRLVTRRAYRPTSDSLNSAIG